MEPESIDAWEDFTVTCIEHLNTTAEEDEEMGLIDFLLDECGNSYAF